MSSSPSGVRWYVGAPGCGKTTRALRDARSLVAELGYPLLVIDSAGAEQLGGVPHVASVYKLLARVWGEGRHTAYVPDGAEQVEAILAAAYQAGEVVVLIDESAFWLTARRNAASWLLRLMRSHRHARVWLLLTTQHLSGDVPQEALACSPEVLVSRVTSPTALELLERRYGLATAHVAALPVGRFIRADLAASGRKTLENGAGACPDAGAGGPGAETCPPGSPAS